MKKRFCIFLTIMMILSFAMPSVAAETSPAAEPELVADAYTMTYYVGGYGAIPSRYHCQVRYPEEGYSEWFDISFGDPIVENWPTEAGTHTVTFEKTTAIEGAGDREYTFSVSMNITVLELPATSGSCGDSMTWNFDPENDTLTISGTGDMYTVAESQEDFWNENYGYEPGWWKLPVKHVIVEEGVENLSNYAFFQDWNGYYRIHETIKLPTTLTAIPEMGFLCSTAMTSLVIPEGITSLTGWPFGSPGNSFTALTDLYLPSTLTELDITTVMLSGLDNRHATQTLQTIHFAGTQEQWDTITYVESESIKELLGEDYEDFYENWCKPLQERFYALDVVFASDTPTDPDDWESEMDGMDGIVQGDLDGNASVNNRDVEYLLWHTLFAEDYPVNQNADYDQNGLVDNKDVEYLLWHTLFPEDFPLPTA